MLTYPTQRAVNQHAHPDLSAASAGRTLGAQSRPKGSTAMANDTTITLVGNLCNEVELRFTPSGAAVANFTVASTPRSFDKQRNEWVDGEPLFLRCSIWRDAAENVAESLGRGTRVIVSGRLKSRSYETKEGERRTVIELEVDEIGPSLRSAKATVVKAQRGGAGVQPAASTGWGGQGSGGGWGAAAAAPVDEEVPF